MDSIQEILEEHNIPIAPDHHEHVTSSFIQVDCPYCTPAAGHFRLGLAKNGRAANCWSCGKLSLSKVLMDLLRVSFPQVKELLHGIRVEIPTDPVKRGRLELPPGLGEMRKVHIRYLRERHFCAKTLTRLWGVQGIDMRGGKLAWRLFLPYSLDGAVVSWTTRRLTNDEPRYWSAKPEQEIISHKSILGGMDYVRHAAIICEGPFDAYRIGPGAVWTSGLSYTQEQLLLMAKIPVRAICFDMTDDAQKRADVLCRELSLFPGRTHKIELETGADPAVAKKKEIMQIRRCFLGD